MFNEEEDRGPAATGVEVKTIKRHIGRIAEGRGLQREFGIVLK